MRDILPKGVYLCVPTESSKLVISEHKPFWALVFVLLLCVVSVFLHASESPFFFSSTSFVVVFADMTFKKNKYTILPVVLSEAAAMQKMTFANLTRLPIAFFSRKNTIRSSVCKQTNEKIYFRGMRLALEIIVSGLVRVPPSFHQNS